MQPGGVLGELEALGGARVQDRGGVEVAERGVPQPVEHRRADGPPRRSTARAAPAPGANAAVDVPQLLLLALAPAAEVVTDLLAGRRG